MPYVQTEGPLGECEGFIFISESLAREIKDFQNIPEILVGQMSYFLCIISTKSLSNSINSLLLIEEQDEVRFYFKGKSNWKNEGKSNFKNDVFLKYPVPQFFNMICTEIGHYMR